MPQGSLFRDEAVDKMLSPDELDRLMRVVDPRGWLALVGLLALVVPAALWALLGTIPDERSADDGILLHRDALHAVVSQTSGLVTDVEVETGDTVTAGQVLIHLRTEDGAEAEVVTLFGGEVVDVPVGKGMLVDRGEQVAVVEQGDEPLQAVFFVPAEDGKQLRPGMQVHVAPSTSKTEEFGYLQGVVLSVSQLPVTQGDMLKLLQYQSLVDTLRVGTNQLQVSVGLQEDPTTPSGFRWSSSRGPQAPLVHGTPATATFVLGTQHPVDLVGRGDHHA